MKRIKKQNPIKYKFLLKKFLKNFIRNKITMKLQKGQKNKILN